MDICKTDIKTIISLLERSADLVNKLCQKPRDLDIARQAKKMSKKLKKKISE